MSTIYDWMKHGQTMVPNIIFNMYSQLNLSSDELVVIIYLLSRLSQQREVRDIETFSHNLGWDMTRVMTVLNQLTEKDYLTIELKQDDDGKQSDHYSLRPFFNQLDALFYEKDESQEVPLFADTASGRAKTTDIVEVFEKEFGRVLSPLELETLNQWIHQDYYSEDLIKLALKEAAIRNVHSINYIDKILLSWQKSNIKTVAEAKMQIKQHRYQHQPKASNEQNTTHQSSLNFKINDWHQNK